MSDWARDIFIIEADNDSLVTQEEREALKKCYPRAKIYTFQGTGHAAWITHQNEYLHQITTFLA
jgi:pimeloyl-ACP methyl ester carboxylesterase